MKLSVVIPARNEAGSIEATLAGLTTMLRGADIEHEIVVVDDSSQDRTRELVEDLIPLTPGLRLIRSPSPAGFGFAVRAGLDAYQGDAVAIVMADGSDDPADLVTYHRLLAEGFDCALGSRFMPGAETIDYPLPKLILNRAVNHLLRILFRHDYDDTTNAFKAYRREAIESVQPLTSERFEITVELPLRALIRGHSYAIVPISWRNRSAGSSKFAIAELGSSYLMVTLRALRERRRTSSRPRSDGTRLRGETSGDAPRASATGQPPRA